MRKVSITAAALSAAAVMLLSGCGPTTLVLPSEQTVSANFQQSDIHAAILDAANARAWRVVSDKPGTVRLAYPSNNRATKYEATFDVVYTKTGYKIKYVKSYGLDEKPNCAGDMPCIHRNVNKWVSNLNTDIQRFLLNPRAK